MLKRDPHWCADCFVYGDRRGMSLAGAEGRKGGVSANNAVLIDIVTS